MRPTRLLPPALLAVALLSGCTSGGGEDADEPEAFRPPPAGALDAGPCSLVGADVVDLGRLATELRGRTSPDQAAKDTLLAAQERVAGFAEGADAAAKPALDRLVLRTGAVRIQSDTGMLRDETLEALDEAYDEAVEVCSGSAGPTPTAG